MPSDRNTLEPPALRGVAVMAIDYSERVTAWNKQAERLLGLPASKTLGKPCYEVLAGRDIYGNRYCYRACPIARQARFYPDEPVRTIPLDVQTAQGSAKRVIVGTFAVASSRRSLATVVHVIEEPKLKAPKPPGGAGNRRTSEPMPSAAIEDDVASAIVLTARELEVLRCIAKGLPTPAIARKLGIQTVTVRNHVQTILRRLDVHTRLAAVLLATRRKLL